MKKKYLTSWFKKNGSTICTIAGCIGVGLTSVLSVRAGMKTQVDIENIQDLNIVHVWDNDNKEITDTYKSIKEIAEESTPTKMQIAKTCWRHYIPVAISIATTMLLINGSDKLNKRNQAALASAYFGLQNYLKEFKRTLSANGINELEIDDKLFHESVDDFISEDDEKHLFYYIYVKDDIGNIEGKYFESTIRDVILSEYHINRNFILKGGMTVNETLEWFNLPRIPMGDVLCWDICNESDYQWIDFEHEKIVNDADNMYKGRECYIITCPFEAEVPADY